MATHEEVIDEFEWFEGYGGGLQLRRPNLRYDDDETIPQAVPVPDCTQKEYVMHLIRASLRYCSWKDRKKITAALRPIYTAPSVEAATEALDDFELEHGDRYPGIVALWRQSWERFIPFLAYPAVIRKIVYTTNMIESVNYQLRKVTRNRGHFPDDDAALKLLRLVARDIATTRGGAAGTGTYRWKEALNFFELYFPGRLDRATL